MKLYLLICINPAALLDTIIDSNVEISIICCKKKSSGNTLITQTPDIVNFSCFVFDLFTNYLNGHSLPKSDWLTYIRTFVGGKFRIRHFTK